jgi:hypothetical protein
MELLKFTDSPKSSRRGKNPAAFIGAGIMVAVMGLSSTLAGTITINSSAAVEFGQGIVDTAACDSSIKVTPVSSYSYSDNAFTVSEVTVSNVGFDSSGNADGRGCKGQVLELRAYNSSGTLLDFYSDTATTSALNFRIPADTVLATSFAKGMYDVDGSGATTGSTRSASPTLAVNSGTTGSTASATDASALSVTLGGLKLSATVTRITVESRASRSGSDEATP